MAYADEHEHYDAVEPIFNGSSIRLPFFKDYACPGTFIFFFADCWYANLQLIGWIIGTTPAGDLKINLFHAPCPQDNLSIVQLSFLYGMTGSEINDYVLLLFCSYFYHMAH